MCIRPGLSGEFFGTILGTIYRTSNRTANRAETSKIVHHFWGGFWHNLWYDLRHERERSSPIAALQYSVLGAPPTPPVFGSLLLSLSKTATAPSLPPIGFINWNLCRRPYRLVAYKRPALYLFFLFCHKGDFLVRFKLPPWNRTSKSYLPVSVFFSNRHGLSKKNRYIDKWGCLP